MISFCGVYFHNFTLCHFYALVILIIGIYYITLELFICQNSARVLDPDHIVVT
jgi:hypothetical protein